MGSKLEKLIAAPITPDVILHEFQCWKELGQQSRNWWNRNMRPYDAVMDTGEQYDLVLHLVLRNKRAWRDLLLSGRVTSEADMLELLYIGSVGTSVDDNALMIPVFYQLYLKRDELHSVLRDSLEWMEKRGYWDILPDEIKADLEADALPL